ncbi:MAG: HAD family hydrolase [Thermoplasmata archaeon]
MVSAHGTKIRAVLFDVGGTLVDERDFSGWADIARRLFLQLDTDNLAHAYSEVELEFDAHPPDGTQERRLARFWHAVLSRAAERELEPEVGLKFLRLRMPDERPIRLYSDVRRCLDTLAAQKRHLGIVSNSSSEASLRRLLDRVGVLRYFERIVSSGTEGVAKPDPAIFHRATERLQVEPQETLYVGNLPWTDARGAMAAGLHSVWLNRDGTGMGSDPPEITSLLEVPLCVREIERGGT